MSNELDDIPVLPFGELVSILIHKMGSYGNMPGHSVPITKYYAALRSSIQRANEYLLLARNADDVAAAQAKLELLKKEEKKIIDGAQVGAIEGLLQRYYVCLAYLEGRRVIVPPADFAGEVDWSNESLREGDRRYTRLRLVHTNQVSPEQRAIIERHIAGKGEARESKAEKTTPTSTGAPGRPTSMHLIESEFRRRAKEALTAATLKEESEILAKWRETHHPEMPPTTPKTIKNRLREAYRNLGLKSPPQAD